MDLLRFVVSPENQVVPDLKGKLPGRGAWVSADRSSVQRAVSKGLFSRAFERRTSCATDLPAMVERLLEDQVVGTLAMANKAGDLVTGFAKVDAMIRNGEAAVLLHASDGSADGKRKLQNANKATVSLGGPGVATFDHIRADLFERALGKSDSVHIAIKHGNLADSLKQKISRLRNYLGTQTNEANIRNEPNLV